ncbi:hypothetical protein HK104_006160 [Borealophlyctis nickersoniae]|nr:hypothetical protein HK104_006160 [Borealophlyctis nickersoniae]
MPAPTALFHRRLPSEESSHSSGARLSFPTETLLEIVSHLRNSDALATCCRVDKRWGACAAPVLYRRVGTSGALGSVVKAAGVSEDGESGRGVVTFKYPAFVHELSVHRRGKSTASTGLSWGVAPDTYNFEIPDGESMTARQWEQVLRECTKLKSLALHDFDSSSLHLPAQLPSLVLKVLQIHNYTSPSPDTLIPLISTASRTLRTLHLSSPTLSEQSILSILYHTPNLTALHLGASNYATLAAGSEEFIKTIPLICPRITELSLSGCTLLSDASLTTLLSSAIAPSLTYFALQYMPYVSPTTLKLISTSATNLTHLRLCDVAATDRTIADILHGCTRLTSLELHYLNVTNEVLKAIASATTSLRRLDLFECNLVTDLAGLFVHGNGGALAHVSVRWCRNMGLSRLSESPSTHPVLRTLRIDRCDCIHRSDITSLMERMEVGLEVIVVEKGGREEVWGKCGKDGSVKWDDERKV